MPFQQSSNSYSFCIITTRKNLKTKNKLTFFVITFLYAVFEAVLYFCILFGLPVTLAILLFAIVYMKNEFVFGPNIHVCLWAYKQSSEDCWDIDDTNICSCTNFSNSLCLLYFFSYVCE